MKNYSRLMLVLVLLLAFAVIMIACGKEEPPVEFLGGNSDAQESGSETKSPAAQTSGNDNIDFGDMVGNTESNTDPVDADPDQTGGESATDTETDTEKNGVINVGGVMDDGGKNFGEVMTGTPVTSFADRK